MSTRSYIGIIEDDGSVSAKYVHLDGYPTGVGLALLDMYKEYKNIFKIIHQLPQEDFSSLPNLNDLDNDSSQSIVEPEKFNSVDDFFNHRMNYHTDIEYCYLFNKKNNQWLCGSTMHSAIAKYKKAVLYKDFSSSYYGSSPLYVKEVKNFYDAAKELCLKNNSSYDLFSFNSIKDYQCDLAYNNFDEIVGKKNIYKLYPLEEFIAYYLHSTIEGFKYKLNNQDIDERPLSFNERNKIHEYLDYYENTELKNCLEKKVFSIETYNTIEDIYNQEARNAIYPVLVSFLNKTIKDINDKNLIDEKIHDASINQFSKYFKSLSSKDYIKYLKDNFDELNIPCIVRFKTSYYQDKIILSSPKCTSVTDEQFDKVVNVINSNNSYRDMLNTLYSQLNHYIESGKAEQFQTYLEGFLKENKIPDSGVNFYSLKYNVDYQLIVDDKNELNEGCNIQPQTTYELVEIIYKTCHEKGWDCDLNFIDTSKITDMSHLFSDDSDGYGLNEFNGDISKWDTSNVTNMECMFYEAEAFNQPLNNWDVSKVTNMESMFCCAKNFNQPLDNWNTSNVENMTNMFCGADSFNQPLNNWDVSNVGDMSNMFWGAQSFNQPLNNWNVSKVTNMSCMFANATSFNHPLENWDVSNVEYMHSMFYHAKSFNSKIPKFELFEFSRKDPSEELGLDPNAYNPEINKEKVQKNSQQKGRVR